MSPARPDATPAVKPVEVSSELKSLMRRLKLGQLLDTLPERLALARANRLPPNARSPHSPSQPIRSRRIDRQPPRQSPSPHGP